MRLTKISECLLSDIIRIPETILSFTKVRSIPDGQGGCHIALNRGSRIYRLWAYKEGSSAGLAWGQEQKFYQPDAVVSSMSGRATAWIASGEVWVQESEKASPSPLEARLPGAPALVAISETPSRVAITTTNRLFLFDPKANTMLAETEVPNAYTHYSFDTMWFSGHGHLVTGKYASQALWDADNLEKVLDVADLKITAHYVAHANSLDKSGRLFSCIGMGQHLVVIDISRRQILVNGSLPGRGVSAGKDLAFHPEYGNLLFCVNGSGEIILWNSADNSMKVLAREKNDWASCFFPSVDTLTTVDARGGCFSWALDFDL